MCEMAKMPKIRNYNRDKMLIDQNVAVWNKKYQKHRAAIFAMQGIFATSPALMTGLQKELKRSPSLVMKITSTLHLIISSLAPALATAPFDSCHGRVSGINKICFLYSSYCRSQATAA